MPPRTGAASKSTASTKSSSPLVPAIGFSPPMRPAAECPDRRNEPTRPESPVRGDHLRAGGRGREPRISGAGATPSKSSVLIKYERAHEAPLACGRIPRYADRPFDRLARMEEVASQGPDKTPPGLTELFAHWDRHAGYYGDVFPFILLLKHAAFDDGNSD